MAKLTIDPQAPAGPLAAPLRPDSTLTAADEAAIAAAATSDADNPEWTEDEVQRARGARLARRAREAAGLSQAAFAQTFRVSLGRLRDLEQGRYRPEPSLLAYLALVAEDPARVRAVLDRADAAA